MCVCVIHGATSGGIQLSLPWALLLTSLADIKEGAQYPGHIRGSSRQRIISPPMSIMPRLRKPRYKAFVISLTNSSVFLPRLHSPHLVFANLHKILVQLPAFTQMWFMLSHTFFWAWCSYTLRKKRNDKNHSINPKDLTMWPRGEGAIISALLLYLRNLY